MEILRTRRSACPTRSILFRSRRSFHQLVAIPQRYRGKNLLARPKNSFARPGTAHVRWIARLRWRKVAPSDHSPNHGKRSMPTRFAPLSDPDMTPEQRRVAHAVASGPRGGLRGPFHALLRSPELADRVRLLGDFVRFESAIPASLRELAILLVARFWSADYEWHAHRGTPSPLASIPRFPPRSKPDDVRRRCRRTRSSSTTSSPSFSPTGTSATPLTRRPRTASANAPSWN